VGEPGSRILAIDNQKRMQKELPTTYIGPLALRALLLRIQQSAPMTEVRGVPPLVQVDAI
jgi:hypothetical protein